MTKEKAAKILLDFLCLKDQVKKADAIFVLGGSSLFPVKKAAVLFKKGFSDKIFFISYGGTFTNPDWKEGEAKMYYKTLRALGIPDKNILLEEATDNTLDEAKYAISFMKKRGVDPKTVILISRPVHQRRAFATFKKQNPRVRFINSPADESYEINKELIERLAGEIKRLKKYGRKGDLVTQKFPEEVISAFLFLEKKSTGQTATK